VSYAHVLYVDLVGFSRLLMEQQLQRIRELQRIVQATPTYRSHGDGDDIISLPTGDGMALAFFGSPTAPAECAVEIAAAVRGREELPLRMGIHSGPVYHVEDINANVNISGGGINIAQRVMDCGDDGHILVSRTVADVLAQLTRWTNHLDDLGDVEVKHGVQVHLYNLHSEEFGRAETPHKLVAGETTVGTTDAPADAVNTGSSETVSTAPSPVSPSPVPVSTHVIAEPGASVTPSSDLRVSFLYRRGKGADERLLALLEDRLSREGMSVFIDRHLTIGLEWAAEIERQIRSSDAVVVFISEASIYSDMLTMEVQIAHNAAQEGSGKPRILPVRVGYEGRLPQELADVLDAIQYSLWESPDDDARVLDEIVRVLAASDGDEGAAEAIDGERAALGVAVTPSSEPVDVLPSSESVFHPAGGAVPMDSALYITRPTDGEVMTALSRGDSIVLVKGARQMGKTSLLARGLQHAREAGYQVIRTDMQKLNASQLESPEDLYMSLGEDMADQLDLDVYPEDVWRPRRGASINFDRYLSREVLRKVDTHIVWALDEVDRLFSCEFASEVFALFRTWHNERSLDPTGPWRKMTCLIAYATEAHLFITDVNQSPFNVGTRLELSDFTYEEVEQFNERCGSPLTTGGEIARYIRLVGGSPYLVHRGLQQMMDGTTDLADLEATADSDSGIYGDHLRRILVNLAQNEELTEVVRTILRGQATPSPKSFYHLRSAGVMIGDSAKDVRPRCQLYARYLERHLL
jgi:class 3 adenylate cyclase